MPEGDIAYVLGAPERGSNATKVKATGAFIARNAKVRFDGAKVSNHGIQRDPPEGVLRTTTSAAGATVTHPQRGRGKPLRKTTKNREEKI